MNLEQEKRRAAGLTARRVLTKETRELASQIICDSLAVLPEFRAANRIGMFLSMPDEVNLRPLVSIAWKQESEVYLPHVVGRGLPLDFYQYTAESQTRVSRFGIEELVPETSQRGEPSDFDLILVPLVAFDEHCQRIGMGAGYYDRTLAFCMDQQQRRPILIGVAFQVQQQPSWSPCTWDVPLDVIITESAELRATEFR